MRRCALILSAIVVMSCTKTKECDRFVKTINPGLREAGERRASAKDPREGLREAAAVFDRLDADLGKMNLRTRRLRRVLEDYRVLFRRAARAARAAAAADESGNAKALTQNERELQRIRAQERLLVARVNSLCQER